MPFHKQVAPRAGAWIETSDRDKNDAQAMVAPRAGAWIETRAARFLAMRKL